MGFFSGTKKVIKPLVNVSGWMNLRGIAESSKSIASLVKKVFVPQKAKRKETFEQAIKRLNLTEEILQQRLREFKRLLSVFTLIALSIFAYTIYLLSHSHVKGGIVSTVLLFIVLAQIFRYHFWIFQIKQRKLGCTIGEWFFKGLLGRS